MIAPTMLAVAETRSAEKRYGSDVGKRSFQSTVQRFAAYERSATGICIAFQRTSSERMSMSARRNESVDSAPSFSFIRSACSASRQPPESGS